MEFILNTIFWTLALYGLYEIIKNIIYINTYTRFKSKGIYLIIGVKNQEDIIEGFLRSILFKILYGRESYFKNIIVAGIAVSSILFEVHPLHIYCEIESLVKLCWTLQKNSIIAV